MGSSGEPLSVRRKRPGTEKDEKSLEGRGLSSSKVGEGGGWLEDPPENLARLRRVGVLKKEGSITEKKAQPKKQKVTRRGKEGNNSKWYEACRPRGKTINEVRATCMGEENTKGPGRQENRLITKRGRLRDYRKNLTRERGRPPRRRHGSVHGETLTAKGTINPGSKGVLGEQKIKPGYKSLRVKRNFRRGGRTGIPRHEQGNRCRTGQRGKKRNSVKEREELAFRGGTAVQNKKKKIQ